MLSIVKLLPLLCAFAFAVPASINTRDIQYCGGENDAAISTGGDPDSGPGIRVRNLDSVTGTFFLYENSRDQKPWKYITVAPGVEAFVSVCPTFEGRIVRGTTGTNLDGNVHQLGTWVEMAWKPDGHVWGDVSLLRGCDGAAEWEATDGSGGHKGFSLNILDGAPSGAYATKDSGGRALARTVQGGNAEALAWEKAHLSQRDVYLEDGPEFFNPVISSTNGVVRVTFHTGSY